MARFRCPIISDLKTGVEMTAIRARATVCLNRRLKVCFGDGQQHTGDDDTPERRKRLRVNGQTHKQCSITVQSWCSLLTLLLTVSAVAVMAQPSNQRWTLEQCLERALESSPEVHEARAEAQIAETQLAQAKAGRLPRATLTAFLSFIDGAEGDALTGDTTDDLGPYSEGELEVVQPLYTFGRLRHEIRAARQGVTARHATTEKARNAVIAAVKELYYNLLFSRQTKDLLADSQEHLTKALETVEEHLETQEGNVTQQDLLRLRIGLARVMKETFSPEQAISATRGALKRQLGIPLDAPFDIADTRLEPVELQLQPLAFYLERVGQHRPEIAQLEAGLEARKARVDTARSAYYPSFFLASGFSYKVAPNREDQDNPYLKDFNSVSPPGIALGMRWQLDFWMTRAKVAERLAEVARTEIQKQNAESGIALDIQRRYLAVQGNQQKLKAVQTARKAARALLLISLTNFHLGVGEAKEVFNSVGLYTRMFSDYYKAIRDFNIAAARLSQTTGQEVTTLRYR